MRKIFAAEDYLKRKRTKKEGKPKLENKFSFTEDDQMHFIRLPVSLSFRRSRKSFLEMNFYFYCYSLKPQVYWLKKGTHLVVEDIYD